MLYCKSTLALFLLVLAGCTTVTTDDLLVLAQQCQTTTPDNCEVEWAAWNEKEERDIRKEQWDAMFKCPEGYIYWCEDEMCKRTFPPKRPVRSIDLRHSGCVSARSVTTWMY